MGNFAEQFRGRNEWQSGVLQGMSLGLFPSMLLIEKDRALAGFFRRVSLRAGKKRAIVAVARKLIGRIRAAFRQGGSYQLNYEYSDSSAIE